MQINQLVCLSLDGEAGGEGCGEQDRRGAVFARNKGIRAAR